MKSAAVISRESMPTPSHAIALPIAGADSLATPLPVIDFELDTSPPAPTPARKSKVTVLPGKTISGIEAMPHLANQIISLWQTRDLNTLIHNILLDSRDGNRQGFPHEVAKELIFLAKLNLVLRAMEAAPMLGITVAEACQLIENGDHAALGHTEPLSDVWGHRQRSKLSPAAPTQAQKNSPLTYHGKKGAEPANSAVPMARGPISPLLHETPPIPPSVCLDLTTAKTLRHGTGIKDRNDGDLMDQGFYRCIAKELGSLMIPQLVLSDLGTEQRCPWLPAAISFAKNRCHFQKVVLHIDPLAAQEPQLTLAMAAGLDHLVINFNLASGKWRSRAEALAESDPEYFKKLIRRLLNSRDELTRKTGHHCLISIIQINHKSVFHLSKTFVQLSQEEGLTPFRHIAESKRSENAGACHCWSPFIEAHIRTNGHLVACAQDHSGYSFTANLKETTFTDAWDGQLFQNARQRVLRGEKTGKLCEICPHRAAINTPLGNPFPA